MFFDAVTSRSGEGGRGWFSISLEMLFKKPTVTKFRLSNASNYFGVEKMNVISKQLSEMNPQTTLKTSQQDVLTLRHFASIVYMWNVVRIDTYFENTSVSTKTDAFVRVCSKMEKTPNLSLFAQLTSEGRAPEDTAAGSYDVCCSTQTTAEGSPPLTCQH